MRVWFGLASPFSLEDDKSSRPAVSDEQVRRVPRCDVRCAWTRTPGTIYLVITYYYDYLPPCLDWGRRWVAGFIICLTRPGKGGRSARLSSPTHTLVGIDI